jgi:CheY-like chemotaxis protein
VTERRLLVVDDEQVICDLVRDVAKPMGFTVRTTTLAMDFQRLYREFQPTDIVLDVVMPEVDGIELVRWLAAEGTRARLTVMTGYNPKYLEFASLVARGAGSLKLNTLTKPVHVARLREALA